MLYHKIIILETKRASHYDSPFLIITKIIDDILVVSQVNHVGIF